jgi:hypothetical protein
MLEGNLTTDFVETYLLRCELDSSGIGSDAELGFVVGGFSPHVLIPR